MYCKSGYWSDAFKLAIRQALKERKTCAATLEVGATMTGACEMPVGHDGMHQGTVREVGA